MTHHWWTGAVWMIVMFLSAVWTLILTAPIHCKWRNATFPQICSDEETPLMSSTFPANFNFRWTIPSNAFRLSCCEWTACVCTISVDWLRALTALWRGVSPSLDLKSTWAPFSTRTRIPSTLRLPWTARVRGVSEKQMKTDTTLQLQKNSFI